MKLVLKILLLFIVSVSLLCAILKLCKNKENFLSPGDYPISLDKPLLYENYNVKKNFCAFFHNKHGCPGEVKLG